jgi:DNA-binding transcriptional MocR family regulator
MSGAVPHKDFRYIKLADEMENHILAGTYQVGEKLPSIRRLQSRTGFSLTTIYQAFIELEKRGRVEARNKSGYYVKPLLSQILPAPGAKRHRPVAKKVVINSLAASIVRAMGDREFLQLGGTLVAPELLPCRQLSRIIKSIPAARLTEMLTTYENPAGSDALRRQIARRAMENFQRTTLDDILVTNGCIEAVSLCLQAVARPGDAVIVESPTYPWFLQVLEDLKMLALELPTHPLTGLDLKSLEQVLKRHAISACILIPNFHNPLGYLMPDDHKQQLVDMLNQRSIPIIEDDIHGDLYFAEHRPCTLKSFDRKGLVLYCSSFSKTLAPGLRVGWTMPGRFKEKVQQLKLNHTIASATLNQRVVADYLNSGTYDRHLRKLRTALKNQVSNVALSIARHFPSDTRITAPKGGLMLWVELGRAVDGLAIYRAAARHKIAILPGSMCSSTAKYKNCIRISCGFPWSQKIEAGIEKLGEIIAALAT